MIELQYQLTHCAVSNNGIQLVFHELYTLVQSAVAYYGLTHCLKPTSMLLYIRFNILYFKNFKIVNIPVSLYSYTCK